MAARPLAGWPQPAPSETSPVLDLTVVYEDTSLIAVDKPPGVPTTIGKTPGPTVAGSLLARFPDMAAIDARRSAGLVHRLDTGTSGLLLAARNPETYGRLRHEFARKAIVKEYLAVVRGRVDRPQVVSQPLARHPRRRDRMVVARTGVRAWAARTEVAPLISDDDLSVVRLVMRTGVTHQLRLHLALLGHPVLGDGRYGDRRLESGVGGDWHYLHARSVIFDDADLPGRIVTPFPHHWRALFSAHRWPIERTRTD
jgi:23S rRNA pseudouridine1911/1915/1917 synthase